MIAIILLSTIALLVVYRLWTLRHVFKLFSTLKNNMRSLPLVGHSLNFIGSGEDRMTGFANIGREAINNGGITKLWFGPSPFVVIADPEIAEKVMKTNLEKADLMKIIQTVTDNGSIFAPVPIWRPRRKVMAPVFSPKNLSNFVEVFNKQSQIMSSKLRSEAGKGKFSIWNYMTTYTLDAVCETTLGVSINAQTNHDEPFLISINTALKILGKRIISPWTYPEWIFKLTSDYPVIKKCRKHGHGFINNIIKKIRQSMKERQDAQAECDKGLKDNRQKNFAELLIESSNGQYTDLELREETLVLVVAGTDTSAAGASFTAMMLARHPEAQEKIYEELQEILNDPNEPIVAEHLGRMKYLDAFIKESLRLYPPVPIITRKIERDFTLPSGLTLVKGVGVIIHIWAIQRNPEYWGPDTEEFVPERFLKPLKHPAQFMAFSYGTRSCLGYQYAMMSMKTALANLIRKYRILPPATEDRSSTLRTSFEVMMKHIDNFTLEIEKRP